MDTMTDRTPHAKDQTKQELTPNTSGSWASIVKSLVIPRPIAWISTRSASGVDNLSPHSYFTMVSSDPAIIQFVSTGVKDTLRNVLETREFVVNHTPVELFEKINATGTDYPPEINEFDAAGLTREPSRTVAAPRVAESPASMECVLHGEPLRVGNGYVVFGEVRHVAVRPHALGERGPDARRLDPIARLGHDEWAGLGDIRSIRRIPYDSIKHPVDGDPT